MAKKDDDKSHNRHKTICSKTPSGKHYLFLNYFGKKALSIEAISFSVGGIVVYLLNYLIRDSCIVEKASTNGFFLLPQPNEDRLQFIFSANCFSLLNDFWSEWE